MFDLLRRFGLCFGIMLCQTFHLGRTKLKTCIETPPLAHKNNEIKRAAAPFLRSDVLDFEVLALQFEHCARGDQS